MMRRSMVTLCVIGMSCNIISAMQQDQNQQSRGSGFSNLSFHSNASSNRSSSHSNASPVFCQFRPATGTSTPIGGISNSNQNRRSFQGAYQMVSSGGATTPIISVGVFPPLNQLNNRWSSASDVRRPVQGTPRDTPHLMAQRLQGPKVSSPFMTVNPITTADVQSMSAAYNMNVLQSALAGIANSPNTQSDTGVVLNPNNASRHSSALDDDEDETEEPLPRIAHSAAILIPLTTAPTQHYNAGTEDDVLSPTSENSRSTSQPPYGLGYFYSNRRWSTISSTALDRLYYALRTGSDEDDLAAGENNNVGPSRVGMQGKQSGTPPRTPFVATGATLPSTQTAGSRSSMYSTRETGAALALANQQYMRRNSVHGGGTNSAPQRYSVTSANTQDSGASRLSAPTNESPSIGSPTAHCTAKTVVVDTKPGKARLFWADEFKSDSTDIPHEIGEIMWTEDYELKTIVAQEPQLCYGGDPDNKDNEKMKEEFKTKLILFVQNKAKSLGYTLKE